MTEPQPAVARDNEPAMTIRSDQRDFPEWHRGRPRFAVWAIALDDPAVERRLDQMREALHPWLLPDYRRQPHITLHVCGFPAARPEHADDFGPAQLQAHIDAMARAAPGRLALRVGGAFSFASAACLRVRDDGSALQRMRGHFDQAARSHDATPYVPHVTAGLYADAWPMREVQARLRPLAALPDIDLPVNALDWMVYDSLRIGGPLSSLLRVDLATHGVEELARLFA